MDNPSHLVRITRTELEGARRILHASQTTNTDTDTHVLVAVAIQYLDSAINWIDRKVDTHESE